VKAKTGPNYRDLKAMSSSFDDMGAFADDSVNLVGGGEPRRLAITPVTPEVLPLLGVKPALGRVFTPAHEDVNAVVISHGMNDEFSTGSQNHHPPQPSS